MWLVVGVPSLSHNRITEIEQVNGPQSFNMTVAECHVPSCVMSVFDELNRKVIRGAIGVDLGRKHLLQVKVTFIRKIQIHISRHRWYSKPYQGVAHAKHIARTQNLRLPSICH